MQQADIDNRFTYHVPKPGQAEVYAGVRARAKGLVEFLADSCPASRELSLAVTHIEDAVFWANASIARQS